MSRLSITIRTPDTAPRAHAAPAMIRTFGTAVAITLGVAVGIAGQGPLRDGARSATDGAMRAIAVGLPADFAPPSPEGVLVWLRGPTLKPVRANWVWDMERCLRTAGLEGKESGKGSGKAKGSGKGDGKGSVDGRDRAVACLLQAEPGAFCDAGYRHAFVLFSRSTLARAAQPRHREMAASILPRLRDLLRSGALRPWDFRLWRQGGELPHVVATIAASETLPPRAC